MQHGGLKEVGGLKKVGELESWDGIGRVSRLVISGNWMLFWEGWFIPSAIFLFKLLILLVFASYVQIKVKYEKNDILCDNVTHI